MDVVYEPVADHQNLTTSSLRPRCVHQVLDKTLPRFSYVHTTSVLEDFTAFLSRPCSSQHVLSRFLPRSRQVLIMSSLFYLEDLWPRCKKSLNHRFGRTKFSSYDFGAEFSIYRKRNIYTFVYNTVWLI